MSGSFLQGFQGGLGSIMSIYDLKHRRAREKKQDARQAKLDARQEKLWDRQDTKYSEEQGFKEFKDKMELQGLMEDVFDNENHSIMFSPEFANKMNDVYGKSINEGYGNNKRIKQLVPYVNTTDEILGRNQGPVKNKMEPGLLVELEYDDETGKRKTGPWTEGRSNDPSDPVKVFKIDDMISSYDALRKETSSWPKEQRDAILGKAKERLYAMHGDTSLRDERISTEKENSIYKRDRSDTVSDRDADHANDLEIEGLKQKGLTSRALLKSSVSGKSRDPRLMQNDIYKRFGDKYINAFGKVDFGDEEPVINRMLSIGNEFQNLSPGVLDADTTVLLLQKAREGLSFTEDEAKVNAELEWDKISGGGKVIKTPKGKMNKSEFIAAYTKAAPGMAERELRNRFYALVGESIERRGGVVANPLSRRGAQTPQGNMTDADWMAQKRQEQAQQGPIPIYGPGDRQSADKMIQAETEAKGILDSVETPMSGAEIDKIMGQGMKALRAGAPTQSVVDALRKQGIREDLIRGLVDGTTGRQYQ